MKFRPLLILATLVVLLRLPFFNNPAIHIDEQFYLVVADKWVHGGLLPYVDIWDRKPIGIFVIYALAVVAFANAILGYQLIATLFVIATAIVVMRLGEMQQSKPIVPFLAAAIYAVAIMLMEGFGGQTPVFYNLFVASGAMLLFSSISDGPPTERQVAVRAVSACVLFGLALQIKYLCVIECVVLSLYFLVMLYRRRALPNSHLGMLAIAMAFCGLAPTLIAGAIYAATGHWQEFFSANFESIFTKALWRLSAFEYARRFAEASALAIMFLPFAAVGTWEAMRDQGRGAIRDLPWALVLWLLAAFFGAITMGNPSRHYFLPTLVPLALLASLGFARVSEQSNALGRCLLSLNSRLHGYGGAVALLALPVVASYITLYINELQRGEPQDVYALGEYIKAHRTEDCPFIFNRLPILYYLGEACIPSIYAFPNHLSEVSEVRTPGRERLRELERVLASRPSMIFVRRPHTVDTDSEAIGILERALHDDYVLAMERPGSRQTYDIYIPRMSPIKAPSGQNIEFQRMIE